MRWNVICFLFLFVFVSSVSMGLEIQKGDSVYFRIDGYEITTPDFKLNPYFKLYRQNEKIWENVTQTWSFSGGQAAEIPDVEKYYLDIEDNDDVYRIDVCGVKHNMFLNGQFSVAEGRGFKVPELLNAEANSQLFEISPQNTLKLKRLKKDGNSYKIGIDCYNIVRFDANFIQNLEKNYPVSVLVLDDKQEIGNFTTKSGAFKQDLQEDGNEVLLKWEDGKSFTFWLKNEMGNIAGIKISAESLFQQICEAIKNNPDDKSKWNVTITANGNKISLSFAGIQRLYHLDSVDIPPTNPRRDDFKKEKEVYKLRIGVFHDQKNCNTDEKEFTEAEDRSWSPTNFPKHNQFEIREGIDWEYRITMKPEKKDFKEELRELNVKGDNFDKPIQSNDRPEFPVDEMTIRFSLEKGGDQQ